ncbi:hypothetical protein FQA39_LY12252 [Lamprigera yunnana]|nr:hypothetical protein FQA39_LY12252 [Lamprigera yunnana]
MLSEVRPAADDEGTPVTEGGEDNTTQDEIAPPIMTHQNTTNSEYDNCRVIVNKCQPILTAGVAVQVVIATLLKDLVQYQISSFHGVLSSVISSLYFNGTLTAEEAILVAHQLTTDLSKTNNDMLRENVLSIAPTTFVDVSKEVVLSIGQL